MFGACRCACWRTWLVISLALPLIIKPLRTKMRLFWLRLRSRTAGCSRSNESERHLPASLSLKVLAASWRKTTLQLPYASPRMDATCSGFIIIYYSWNGGRAEAVY